MKKSNYFVWGEYGIQQGEYLTYRCRASTKDNAILQAEKVFKKDPHWPMIGRHNMYVRLDK